MRRATAVLAAFVFATLLAPAPAHAWFGWLDNLSGPGPFGGLLYEFRASCFGPKMVLDAAENAIRARRRLVVLDAFPEPSGSSKAQDVLQDIDRELTGFKTAYPLFWNRELSEYTERVERDLGKARDFAERFRMLTRAEQNSILNQALLAPAGLSELDTATSRAAVVNGPTFLSPAALIHDLKADNSDPLDEFSKVLRAVASTGVFVSFCDTRNERQSSIDFGYYHLTAAPNPRWASNNAVHMDTVVAFYSHRLFRNSRFDVADVAFGGGAYWLTSSGLKGFRGVILQPARADLHAPARWAGLATKGSRKNKLLRVAAIPSFRVGLMMFPAGFQPLAFGPSESQVRPGELVPTWGFFLNVQPLLTWSKPKAS